MAIGGPDPERPRAEVPKCDTGKGLVAADGLWATLFGVSGLAAIANDESGVGVALGGVAALFIASAARGNRVANECRGAFESYNVAIREERNEALADRQPAVRRRPAPAPMPRIEHAEPEAPPDAAIEAAPPVDEAPAVTTPPAPAYEAPRPPVVKPVAKPEPKPKPPAKPASEDDWSDFWKEVP